MGKINPFYEYIATSRTGFVQQVACSYVCNGYRFHVSGKIDAESDPREFDEKMLAKYDIRKTDAQRYYNKHVLKRANIQYIRFERDWLMLATPGKHLWKVNEKKNIKDCSKGEPIKFQGYSIYWKDGLYRPHRCKVNRDGEPELDDKKRVRVQICRTAFRELKAEFHGLATKRSPGWLAAKIYNVPYEPYAPVKQQMLEIRCMVNVRRKNAGIKTMLDTKVIRTHRVPVCPFKPLEEQESEAA